MQAKDISLVTQNENDTIQVQLVCDFQIDNLQVGPAVLQGLA